MVCIDGKRRRAIYMERLRGKCYAAVLPLWHVCFMYMKRARFVVTAQWLQPRRIAETTFAEPEVRL